MRAIKLNNSKKGIQRGQRKCKEYTKLQRLWYQYTRRWEKRLERGFERNEKENLNQNIHLWEENRTSFNKIIINTKTYKKHSRLFGMAVTNLSCKSWTMKSVKTWKDWVNEFPYIVFKKDKHSNNEREGVKKEQRFIKEQILEGKPC